MAASSTYAELTVVPRIALQLPVALPPPDGFDPSLNETWPTVIGRLEFMHGRLEYMPPCGELQQRTAADVLTELNLWRRAHPSFAVGGNEAGMLLGGEVRAADAAVWRIVGPAAGGFARTPPILAVEVSGVDETVDALIDKAAWYLGHGVDTVWIVDPATRSAHVITASGRIDVGATDRLPEPEGLPGLAPNVADFFRQL